MNKVCSLYTHLSENGRFLDLYYEYSGNNGWDYVYLSDLWYPLDYRLSIEFFNDQDHKVQTLPEGCQKMDVVYPLITT